MSLCTFAASHKFWYAVFLFSFVSRYALLSLVILLTYWLFDVCIFVIFLAFLPLKSNFIPLTMTFCIFSILLNY